ncbi:AAA family ATPase [Shewanella septentrionalis]|uniref:AAA family ATPase n=1 Tax=Shewanella septentrionalis TaxID=2952223 RepID=A0A9X2WZ17_9GAMM|nr:AAA family ATPase [Shewanella septentrionalis]MCT7947712.1 AAA family ATPase [Shewanella septentrionalis]
MKHIKLANVKGGTGKTSIACSIAEYLHAIGKKIECHDYDNVASHFKMFIDESAIDPRPANPDFTITDTIGALTNDLLDLLSTDVEDSIIIVPCSCSDSDINTTLKFARNLKRLRVNFIVVINKVSGLSHSVAKAVKVREQFRSIDIPVSDYFLPYTPSIENIASGSILRNNGFKHALEAILLEVTNG